MHTESKPQSKTQSKPQSIIENKYQELLAKCKDKINSTMREYIKITAKKNAKLNLWQSKFFGQPYLLKDQKYPTDNNGNNLYLLAQFDFYEIPNSPPFPKQGLLQFWISDNDLYGLNFADRTKQDKFKVIYHKEIHKNPEKLMQDFSFLPTLGKESDWIICEDQKKNTDKYKYKSPGNPTEYSLDFKLDTMPITSCDKYFYKLFESDFKNAENKFDDFNEYEFMDEYDKKYDKKYDKHLNRYASHIIGGYPDFTQEDPRGDGEEYLKQNILLFQMDSDITNEIMWGDMGIANFFINQEDLAKLDFSNVFYNWDCS